MKILIAGCGYLGKTLGRLLASKGNEVWGLSRNPKGLEELGIKPLAADLLKKETLAGLPYVDYVVLAQAPSEPEDNYARTYVEGTRNLLKAIKGKKIKKVVLISSTRVYGTAKGNEDGWVDETTVPELSDEGAKSLLESEKVALARGGIVFRLGGIYGPGRNRIEAIRSGKLVPELTDTYVNRIHVDDAARGIELLLEKGEPGQVYLGVDDYPSTQREFYSWLLSRMGIQAPTGGELKPLPHRATNKRCSNAKVKKLGFGIKFPDYKSGYSDLIS